MSPARSLTGGRSTPVRLGRAVATPPEGTVIFLIGLRVNRPSRIDRWLPVLCAMPRMLAELRRRPDLGLLKATTFLGSNRTILVVQYWKSREHLLRYAHDQTAAHLPAWRSFNRRVGDAGHVGIFHEIYEAEEARTMYVNMPETFGLGATGGMSSPGGRRDSRRAGD